MKSVLVAIVTVLAAATAAQAQIDSPPPALQGEASSHLWSVPGVIRAGGLETFFPCTNTTGAPIRVGIEVFGPAGGAAFNDPSATSLNVAAGATVLFGTGGAAGLSVDGTLGAGSMSKGSARILATSKNLVCTAFVADPAYPPTTSWQLTIIKKTTQKAAN